MIPGNSSDHSDAVSDHHIVNKSEQVLHNWYDRPDATNANTMKSDAHKDIYTIISDLEKQVRKCYDKLGHIRDGIAAARRIQLRIVITSLTSVRFDFL